MESIYGHGNVDVYSPRLNCLWSLLSVQSASGRNLQCPIWQDSGGDQPATWWQDDYTEPLHHGRDSVLFLLEYILTLDMDLVSLPALLLQKPPFVSVQNIFFTPIVFSTLLLPIEELVHSTRSVLMDFAGLIMYPTILKQLTS